MNTVLINKAWYHLRNRGPLHLAKKAVATVAARCRRSTIRSAVLESAKDSAGPDSERIEVLDLRTPSHRRLGAYERLILREGLPAEVPGTCNVCGYGGSFRLRSENFREELVCPCCWASNRKRQVVAVLLRELGLDWQSTLRQHVAELPQAIWVMETGPFADAFGAGKVVASEYLAAECKSGSSHRGVRHEDVMNPSFAEDSLDAVVSCDVFEHVAEPYLAHAEVFRRLKPGGFHVFTVPFREHAAQDEILATLDNGVERYHQPKVYHGDPRRPGGILVYRIFSTEMQTRLQQLGYEVKPVRLRSIRFAMLGPNEIVFVARKPGQI